MIFKKVPFIFWGSSKVLRIYTTGSYHFKRVPHEAVYHQVKQICRLWHRSFTVSGSFRTHWSFCFHHKLKTGAKNPQVLN